jgi:hypothetical protein
MMAHDHSFNFELEENISIAVGKPGLPGFSSRWLPHDTIEF